MVEVGNDFDRDLVSWWPATALHGEPPDEPDMPQPHDSYFDREMNMYVDFTNFDTCASSNLYRPGFITDLNRAGVACTDGDAAPRSRRGRPERTRNVDRASVGDGRTASPNRSAQAQRYAPTVFPFSRSAVLAFAGAMVAGLA